jgi:hypothetical protein
MTNETQGQSAQAAEKILIRVQESAYAVPVAVLGSIAFPRATDRSSGAARTCGRGEPWPRRRCSRCRRATEATGSPDEQAALERSRPSGATTCATSCGLSQQPLPWQLHGPPRQRVLQRPQRDSTAAGLHRRVPGIPGAVEFSPYPGLR